MGNLSFRKFVSIVCFLVGDVLLFTNDGSIRFLIFVCLLVKWSPGCSDGLSRDPMMGLFTDTWKTINTHMMSVQAMQGTSRVLAMIRSSATDVSLSQVGWAAHFR